MFSLVSKVKIFQFKSFHQTILWSSKNVNHGDSTILQIESSKFSVHKKLSHMLEKLKFSY